jgi:hypothetical protein
MKDEFHLGNIIKGQPPLLSLANAGLLYMKNIIVAIFS